MVPALDLMVFTILRRCMTHYQNIFSVRMKENFFPNILRLKWVLKKVFKVWNAHYQIKFNVCVGVKLRRCFGET